MNPIWGLIKVKDLGLICGVWQERTDGSRKITRDAYQLTTAAAITDNGNVDRLNKLQKKGV